MLNKPIFEALIPHKIEQKCLHGTEKLEGELRFGHFLVNVSSVHTKMQLFHGSVNVITENCDWTRQWLVWRTW